MKKHLLYLVLFINSIVGTLTAQVIPDPEIMYYKFDGSGLSVPNYATSPFVGTDTADITGLHTQGGTGICGGALIGGGGASSANYLNTNWATDLTGKPWTISFWTFNIPSTTTTYYIWGDVNAGGFRCFTGGVAGANNWIVRGVLSDFYINGAALTAWTMTTVVYDTTGTDQMRGYVNGVLVNSLNQAGATITGIGPFKVGGYGSSNALPTNSLMDEFRMYNRALSQGEITQLYERTNSNIISATTCSGVSYTSPSGSYTWSTAGTYYDTLTNIYCGDSLITVNLSILNPSSNTISPVSCITYDSPSGNYNWTTSGTYLDTISNSVGCDSIITINLTINNPSTSNISPSTCSSNYTSPSGLIYDSTGTYMDTIPNFLGCDSVITINLTLLPSTTGAISAATCGTPYTGPSGTVYSTPGTYQDTILNSFGCDSIITLNLTFNSVNTGVTQSGTNGEDLMANNMTASYQWIDCNTLAPLSGETNMGYTATANGSYAVIVNDGTCIDTSACFTVAGLSIDNNTFAELVKIYPNPTTGKFFITVGANNQTFTLELINNVGQVLQSTYFTNTNVGAMEITGNSGTYFVRITKSNGEKAILRIIKD